MKHDHLEEIQKEAKRQLVQRQIVMTLCGCYHCGVRLYDGDVDNPIRINNPRLANQGSEFVTVNYDDGYLEVNIQSESFPLCGACYKVFQKEYPED